MVLGPFFVEGSPRLENGEDLGRGAPGQPCFTHGHVLSLGGTPTAGARIEVWRADEVGFYDVEYDDLDELRGRGHLFSEEDGRWWFCSVRPEGYPIPTDVPIGDLLGAANRSPMCPAHAHFKVSARLRRLASRFVDRTSSWSKRYLAGHVPSTKVGLSQTVRGFTLSRRVAIDNPWSLDGAMRLRPPQWMFPYVLACRTAGVLELDSGDVLGLSWDRRFERPKLVPQGHGHRCIVIRVQRAWHGYANKVVVSPMGEGPATG